MEMNILIITPTFFPIRGGTEQVIYDVSQEYIQKGHTVTVLSNRKQLDWPIREEIDGINVIRFKDLRFKFSYLFLNIYLCFKIWGLNRKEKFDLITQYHVFPLGLGAIWGAKLSNVKFVTSLSGWDTYDPIQKIKPIYVKFMSWVMNNSDAVTSPSTQMAQIATDVQGCKKKFTVIPHGTRLQYSDEHITKPIYKKFKALDKQLVVSIQRLHERKGLKYLLEAIPQILKEKPNTHFIIGGKGPEEEALKALAKHLQIEEHVSFEGFVKDEDLPQYYAMADLFALPTLYEAFGLVYVDALTYGTPIVTCENAGSKDLIHKDNGIVVPIKDSQAFGKAVVTALSKEWNSNTIMENAQKYRWPVISEQYLEVFNSIKKK